MPLALWIGIIAGFITIVGAIIALGKKYFIPYLRKKIDEPLDPSQPINKDALEYKDIRNAITLLVDKLRPKNPDVILGIDRGGAIVGGILAKHFGVPIHLLHRSDSKEGFCSYFDSSEVDGKVVALVDDASRTGRSIEKAKNYVKNQFSPQNLMVAVVLLTKTEYLRHKDITAAKLVDCYAYFTSRSDIKLPWDKRE
jgi:hypoxanthine phosphoribosyltransferase